jgi:thymidylate synthase
MKAYLDLLRHVMTYGKDREDRTGVGTRAVFGYQFRHDLRDGFPLLTTKKVHVKSILHELLWFLRGETNVRSLQAAGVTIWDEWADANGDLGPVYGKQWRKWDVLADEWETIDQIANLVRDLKANPFSRRHIVTAWNPADVPAMKLPPCHTLWQCYVEEGGYRRLDPNRDTLTEGDEFALRHHPDAWMVIRNPHPRETFIPDRAIYRRWEEGRQLSLHLYARSIDSFLGLPFNIASYAFLLSMLAHVTGYAAGELIISFGDLHIYRNHFDQVNEQLRREPYSLPELVIAERGQSIDGFVFEDFRLVGYESHPAIKAPVAV